MWYRRLNLSWKEYSLILKISGCPVNVHMTIYPLTNYYYIIERVYFIYRLFILFISTFSYLLFLYTYSIMEGLTPCQYRYFALYYVLYYQHDEERNIRLFYTTFVVTIQKRSRFEPGPPSPLFVALPLINV